MILFREVTLLDGDVVVDQIEKVHDPVVFINENGLLTVVVENVLRLFCGVERWLDI